LGGQHIRQIQAGETHLALTMPRESLNDVLKSLDIVVHQGGPLLSVDYETPTDRAEQLEDLSISLGKNSSLRDLIAGLSGTQVLVATSDGTQFEGRVVGIEADPADSQPAVLVLQQADALRLVALATITGITIRDERATADVQFLLDVSRKEQSRTSLTVRLAPGIHDVALSYLAPSPTWRVSYRIAGIDTGRARLVGWRLFDNTLDEDLDQVELTLISGRPISFRYDLAETRVPSRPQVSDDPTALEQATGDRGLATALSSLIHDLRSPMTAVMGYADLLKRNMVGTLTSEQHEFVSAIRSSMQRLSEHMRALTDLVRIRDSNDPTLPGQLYRGSPLGDLKVSSSYFFRSRPATPSSRP
jgi:signal transduction histidine kinase